MSAKGLHQGFTLVEIMVALAIGLFLLAGMIQMYVSNKQTFRFSQALSQMQENGRYALALIARDMRMADFWGCTRSEDVTVQLAGWCEAATGTAEPADTTLIAMEGTDGSPRAGLPDEPDTITLRGATGAGLTVAAGTTEAVLNVEGTVENAVDVLGDTSNGTGDIALLSNCQGGNLFQVTDISGGSPAVIAFDTSTDNPGNASAMLSDVYDQTATVHAWREVQYFVQDGKNGDPALWMRKNRCALADPSGDDNDREVVEGVENIQIAYGEDVNGDGTADRYVPRANVTSMDAVVSIRVNLLLASAQDNLVDEPQQIAFDDYDDTADDTFAAPDRRLYQVMSATFAVRNRPL